MEPSQQDQIYGFSEVSCIEQVSYDQQMIRVKRSMKKTT